MKKRFLLIPLVFWAACTHPRQSVSADYQLADSIHFDHAIVDELRKITPAKFERLVTSIEEYDFESRRSKTVERSSPDALEFEADSTTTALLSGLKENFNARGYLIFLSEENFGNAPNKFAVLKSADQFDILRCRLTQAVNYDIGTDSLIKKLKEWNSRYPFEITGAHIDWVSANFITPPDDFGAFAKEVYAFCPDVVDQGTGTVEALADEMKTGNWLYLWWD